MDADSMPDSLPSLEMSNPSTMETFGDPSDEPIEIPGENDVLCGRGGSINSHKGNEQFRDLVEKRKRVYLTARFKREKRLIASSIVSEIRAMDPPGRFLARKGNKDTGFWYDIGDEKARDKTSQALRENAPTIRAVIETEINEQRAEMKRKEVEHFPPNPAPSYDATPAHPYYAQVPAHPPAHQSYWDWYHHYYGYPPPAHMPPPHYPPPPPHAAMAAPLIPIVIPAHPPPPHPPHDYWGQPVVPTAAGRKRDGEEFKDESSDDEIDQEEEDHRLAMELQQQEKAALYEARKSRYKNTLANRSNAHLGSASTRAHPAAPKPQHPVARKPPPSPSFQDMDATDLTQEELDHRLALALQEEEEKALRQHIATVDGQSRKTSRSNACFQAPRARRKESMSSDNSSSFGPFDFPASFVAWMNNDSSGRSKPAQRRRSVQFKDEDMTSPLIAHQPGNVQRQSSTASADRPLQSQAEQNTSLLSQVAHHIIGSWENLGGSHSKAVNDSHDDHMETEGLEVQLRDPHDETSLPSPSPRVQIDWSSRIDGGQSWIPESLNANWANSNNSLSGSTHAGISSVNSLDMDTSGNQGSLGGASLCQLFDQDESMQRALREVPSWERSMRSKSPLSMASADETDLSLIRVRELKLFRAAATHIRRSSSGEMDWDDNPENS